jgi:hypothetical protein
MTQNEVQAMGTGAQQKDKIDKDSAKQNDYQPSAL